MSKDLRAQSSAKICPRRSQIAIAVSVALMTTVATTPSSAQTLEEIVVTATKRDESVQDVPLAITAFSGDFTRTSIWTILRT